MLKACTFLKFFIFDNPRQGRLLYTSGEVGECLADVLNMLNFWLGIIFHHVILYFHDFCKSCT